MLDEINLLAGQIQYDNRRYDAAAHVFQRVTNGSSGSAAAALYNVSLSWLQQADARQFAVAKEELATKTGEAQAAADLLLEQGLTEASRGDKRAAELLQRFIRDYPAHPRTAEGWVALAELAFHDAPPRVEEAQKHLARAAENRPSEAARERADYLAIWIEDAHERIDDAKLIALANHFIERHATSQHIADVRLKLAETFFRRQDFPSAQTQFEILAQQNSDAARAGKAQFFAAQSSMQSMGEGSLERALILFDAVVKGNGELKWAARNEQAVIERKLGKPQDALTLYDEVIRGDAGAPDKREALCGKADVLYELGTIDSENYRRSIELYDQIAGQKGASGHWRNQALFKKGMCLEKLSAPTEALATFYTIVESEVATDSPREFFWFYKAGFNAARLLEEDSKWQPAASIYEKLAFAGGARSEEAKSRLNRLRLEHFLWEQ
jgi:TolA-binding protein